MTDLSQFEVFMKNYQDMVFSAAVRLTGSAADAEDIAQEVFLKAFERFPDFEGITHLGGWLRRIATNLSLNHLSRYRARWRFFSEMSDDGSESVDEKFAAPEAELPPHDEAERRQLLEAALHKLPDHQRVPLVLHHFEEMSYEEIAAHLHVSLSKVKIDIHRGREALRKKMQTALGRELADSP